MPLTAISVRTGDKDIGYGVRFGEVTRKLSGDGWRQYSPSRTMVYASVLRGRQGASSVVPRTTGSKAQRCER